MLLPDVNILLNAFRKSADFHEICLRELEGIANGIEPFLLLDQVKIGFLRISTLRQLYRDEVSIEKSVAFIQALENSRAHIKEIPVSTSLTFLSLLLELKAEGNFVPDIYLAAVAKDLGATILSLDDDFSRIPGVRWRKPAALN